ncbi:MAG TPA: energy-coupling factor ABC transporter permease [Halothiobacillus sp.]|nr:MAG: hypothetical protein B7Z82_00545 [Halothiobacillus sp. 20-54-6]HQT42924.1 energy-coupling factor ABC transporter permease [Halothiobacillus sp.]
MNVSDGLISFEAALLGWISLGVLLGFCTVKAPWRALWQSSVRQNLSVGSGVFLLLLWLFHADALPGLSLHFFGLTAVTLVIGWQLALLVSTLAVLMLAGINHAGFAAVGWAVWGMVVPPIVITTWVNRCAQRCLPPNFFIYLFVNVFFAAILGFIAAALASAGLMSALGIYPWPVLVDSYLALLPIQVIPEAMMNGMVMLGLTLLRPDWVISFDGHRYFKN